MKTNPLFHDSSVSQDANVQTKFELIGLKALGGERVFLRLSLDQSKFTFYEMHFNEEKELFDISVWLKHRKELSYSFLVKRGEEWVASTTHKKGHAMHSLLDHWVSLKGDELQKELEEIKKSSGVELVELRKKSSEEAPMANGEEFFDNLIKKWDL